MRETELLSQQLERGGAVEASQRTHLGGTGKDAEYYRQKHLWDFTAKKLQSCKRNLEHAKLHREGGLLFAEGVALLSIIEALKERDEVSQKAMSTEYR